MGSGSKGGNFVEALLRVARRNKFACWPTTLLSTCTADLAERVPALIESKRYRLNTQVYK